MRKQSTLQRIELKTLELLKQLAALDHRDRMHELTAIIEAEAARRLHKNLTRANEAV